MSDDQPRWRVTLSRPDGLEYAQDVRDSSMMGALGHALHDFSMRHSEIRLDTLREGRVVRVDAPGEQRELTPL